MRAPTAETCSVLGLRRDSRPRASQAVRVCQEERGRALRYGIPGSPETAAQRRAAGRKTRARAWYADESGGVGAAGAGCEGDGAAATPSRELGARFWERETQKRAQAAVGAPGGGRSGVASLQRDFSSARRRAPLPHPPLLALWCCFRVCVAARCCRSQAPGYGE